MWNDGSNGSLTSYASRKPSHTRGAPRHGWCDGARVATASATSNAAAKRASRCQPRGASAGTRASTSKKSTRQPSRCGCSSRSQLSISTTPGTRHTSGTRRLRTSRLRKTGSTEHGCQVVALAQDGDRGARRLEAEQGRFAVVRPVDVDERRVAAPPGPLLEPVDDAAVEPRRHDDEVERERGRVSLAGKQLPRRLVAVRLCAGEQLERAAPVAFGLDALDLDLCAPEHERGTPTSARMRVEDGAGGTHRDVEDPSR